MFVSVYTSATGLATRNLISSFRLLPSRSTASSRHVIARSLICKKDGDRDKLEMTFTAREDATTMTYDNKKSSVLVYKAVSKYESNYRKLRLVYYFRKIKFEV